MPIGFKACLSSESRALASHRIETQRGPLSLVKFPKEALRYTPPEYSFAYRLDFLPQKVGNCLGCSRCLITPGISTGSGWIHQNSQGGLKFLFRKGLWSIFRQSVPERADLSLNLLLSSLPSVLKSLILGRLTHK